VWLRGLPFTQAQLTNGIYAVNDLIIWLLVSLSVLILANLKHSHFSEQQDHHSCQLILQSLVLSNGSPAPPVTSSVASLGAPNDPAADDEWKQGKYLHPAYVHCILIAVQVPDHLFHLNVTLEHTEQTFTTRGPAKPKTVPDSKCGPKQALLHLLQSEVVGSIYEVHGLHDCYLPGPISGPPFKINFKGFLSVLCAFCTRYWN
jgi:hypothetical protein